MGFALQSPRARASQAGPQAVRVSREARQGIFLILCALGAAAYEKLIKQLHHTATFSVIRSMKQRFKAVCARRARRSKSRLAWRGVAQAVCGRWTIRRRSRSFRRARTAC